MKMSVAIVLLVLSQGLAGCDGPDSSPVPPGPSPIVQIPPTPAPPPRRAELFTFIDSMTGFSTSDVYDVQEQIVQFSSADELIWVAADTRFPEFIADGNLIAYHHRGDWFFQVRFGTNEGERRAYLTWPDNRLNGLAPTILDLWVDERGDLKIVETRVPVPGT
jgi:hypothetical protein